MRVEFSREYMNRLGAAENQARKQFLDYFRPLILVKLKTRSLTAIESEGIVDETVTRVLTSLEQGQALEPDRLTAFVNSTCNHVLSEHYRALACSVLDDTSADWQIGGLPAEETKNIFSEHAELVDTQFARELTPRERVRLEELERQLEEVERDEADKLDADYDGSRAERIAAALDRIGYEISRWSDAQAVTIRQDQ